MVDHRLYVPGLDRAQRRRQLGLRREVRAEQVLLLVPEEAQVGDRLEAGRRAAHHEPAAPAQRRDRGRPRVLAGVLEHDVDPDLLVISRTRAATSSDLRSITSVAPISCALATFSAPPTTGIGFAPKSRQIWIAITPRPPTPPQMRTFSPAWILARVTSIRHAVSSTSGIDAASSNVRLEGFGSTFAAGIVT